MEWMISVTIPVGPYPANKRWLRECIDSVIAQTMQPTDVVLIDDGANLDDLDWLHELDDTGPLTLRPCVMPWRTGISHAFNYGVMLARNDCVFMLGSDDTLEPTCLEKCWEAYLKCNRQDAYYSVPIRYMDTGEIQTIPCNAAMVTKGLWRRTGGFPIETSMGAGDAALLSILKANYDDKGETIVQWVGHLLGQDETPLYNYRRHPDIHTYKLNWPIVNQLRIDLTNSYKETPELYENY